MNEASMVSVLMLIVMIIEITAHVLFMHRETMPKVKMLNIFIYSISFTHISCFIVVNPALFDQLVDVAFFCVAPFTFLLVGWVFAIYYHSFYALFFTTIHISLIIVNNSLIVFSIVSFLLICCHLAQLVLDHKVNDLLYKIRQNEEVIYASFIMFIVFNVLYVIAMICISDSSKEFFEFFKIILVLYIISYAASYILPMIHDNRGQNFFMVLISLNIGVFWAIRTVSCFVFKHVLATNFILLFLFEFIYLQSEDMDFEFNGNSYRKTWFGRAMLTKQGENNIEVIGIVYKDQRMYRVTSYDVDCFKDYSHSVIIFDQLSSIKNFNKDIKVASVREVLFDNTERPSLDVIGGAFSSAYIFGFSEKNKFMALVEDVIYVKNPMTVFVANIRIRRLLVRRSIKYIGSYACNSRRKLKYVYFPDSLLRIGLCSFKYCVALKSVCFPPNLVSIGIGAFYDCRLLKNVSFRRCKRLKSIDHMTFQWTAIEEIILPKSIENLGNDVFEGCFHLREIKFQEGHESVKLNSLKSYATTKLIIPRTWRVIQSKFSVHTKKLEVVFPNPDEWELERIENNAFKTCNYQTFIVPRTVKYIGDEAFSHSKELVVIEFARGSKLRKCYSTAFDHCKKLKFMFYDDNVLKILRSIQKYNSENHCFPKLISV